MYKLDGDVAPGYEPISEQFATFYKEGLDKNSQLCIYVGEQKVIDIWGCTPQKAKPLYGPEHATQIWGSSKVCGSIMMAVMKDKGLISYDEKVSTYWPEFA